MAARPHPVTQLGTDAQEQPTQGQSWRAKRRDKRAKRRAEWAKMTPAERAKKRATQVFLFIKLLAVAAALAVLVIGLVSLWDARHHAPAAEPFTRVGGATSIETSVDAARFWLNSPQTVVEVRVNASPHVMLSAAGCAVREGAPLLVTAPGHVSRIVRATTSYWKLSPSSILQFWGKTLPGCPATGSTAKPEFALLNVPTQRRLIRLLPAVPARRQLARFVVFAAAISPGHLPDVAVGAALAAHLSAQNHGHVSLVFTQPYVAADPALESQLRRQHQPVTGGLVLGETPTVPQDTAALLRQMLRTPDQQSLLSQIQASLQNTGAVLTALLAFAGVAAAAGAGGSLVIELLEDSGRWPRHSDAIETSLIKTDVIETRIIQTGGIVTTESPRPRRWRFSMPIWTPRTPRTPRGRDWRAALGDQRPLTVICWLRSGKTVSGTIKTKNPSGDGPATLWRLDAPQFLGASGAPKSGPVLNYLLVPIDDIELVGVPPEKTADNKATANGEAASTNKAAADNDAAGADEPTPPDGE